MNCACRRRAASAAEDGLAFSARTSVKQVTVNASNGKTLFQSLCYYTYFPDGKIFALYQPMMDTSGESKVLQSKCFGLQQ
jgi:hypothetical protein